MMQGFASQLISGEVSSDIGTTNRHEIPELCIPNKPSPSYIALDQNFNNQSGINYVSIGVPSDLSLNRGIFNTVSLPQTIVGSIDQNHEGLPSVYVPSTDPLLDKSIPIGQGYQTPVNSILPIGTVVPAPEETTLSIEALDPITPELSEKLNLLKELKLSYEKREFDSLSLSEIPDFLKEYNELRKAFLAVNKDVGMISTTDLPDSSNPPISLLPQLLSEYKSMVENMKKTFVCTICNKSFTTRFSLKTHMVIHADLKPFECPYEGCNKCFRTKSTLNTHISLIHTVEKDYICSACGKAYSKPWLLKQHERRHHIVQRCQCKHCSKSFTYPYQLKNHIMVKHEGIKAYTCSYEGCNKQFSSKSSLRIHELSHQKSFVCPVCLTQFGYACDLKRHLKKVHSV